ncbi:hypothetical protein NCS52_01037600 [Fusarium sp. LHS14.1]|nr:hypothetical protein NCS52_01037600 [Fusarium sp. LHS14.1]
MSHATPSQSGEESSIPIEDGPLDGYTVGNGKGAFAAGWSCSAPLKDEEMKDKIPDGKNRRTEADDASYRCCNINPNSAKTCERCGARFDVGTEALDKDGKVIGTINKIEVVEVFLWKLSEEYPTDDPSSCEWKTYCHRSRYDKRCEP